MKHCLAGTQHLVMSIRQQLIAVGRRNMLPQYRRQQSCIDFRQAPRWTLSSGSSVRGAVTWAVVLILAIAGGAWLDRQTLGAELSSVSAPDDGAVIELEAPAGATVSIDGADLGTQRRFEFRPLPPGQLFPYRVQVRSEGGQAVERTFLVRAGWLIRWAPPIANDGRAKPVLQIGHAGSAQHATFSPNGRLLLTSDYAKGIVWDIGTGRCLRRFAAPQRGWRTSQLFPCPDGRLVLRGAISHDSKDLTLWDMVTGQVVRSFSADSSDSLCLSRDGTQTLSAGMTAILWETATGQQRHVLRGHRSGVEASVFSRDGSLAATGDYDGTVIVWETRTGKLLHTLHGHQGTIRSLAFSPDGQRLLSGADMQNHPDELILWDVRAGKQQATFTLPSPRLVLARFRPDGKRILAAVGKPFFPVSVDDMGQLIVWDVQNGRELHSVPAPVREAALSPDGSRLATVGRTTESNTAVNVLTLFDAETLEQAAHVRLSEGWISAVTFVPDGKEVVTLGHDAVFWDAEDLARQRALPVAAGDMSAAVFSPGRAPTRRCWWVKRAALVR